MFVDQYCNVRLTGIFEAKENTSNNGGAIYVSTGAKLYITRNSKVNILGNTTSSNENLK